jgi:hypothetical protein
MYVPNSNNKANGIPTIKIHKAAVIKIGEITHNPTPLKNTYSL